LADRFDVGVWYKRVEERVGMFRHETYVYCGPVVNGVELDQPQCRTVDECVRQILEDYRNEVKRRSEPPPPPPPPDPAEELLREWPELQAFGVEWVSKWLDLRDRLIEIAKTLRRFPWMGGGEAEVDEHPPPLYDRSVHDKGRVGDLPIPKPTQGFLRTRRSRERDQTGAGV